MNWRRRRSARGTNGRRRCAWLRSRRGLFPVVLENQLRGLALQLGKATRETGQDIRRGLVRRRRRRSISDSELVNLALRVGEAGGVASLTSLVLVTCIVHRRQLGYRRRSSTRRLATPAHTGVADLNARNRLGTDHRAGRREPAKLRCSGAKCGRVRILDHRHEERCN